MEPTFEALFLTGGEDLLQEVMVHGAVAGGCGGAVQPAEEGGQQYSSAEHGTGSGGWRWRGFIYLVRAGLDVRYSTYK